MREIRWVFHYPYRTVKGAWNAEPGGPLAHSLTRYKLQSVGIEENRGSHVKELLRVSADDFEKLFWVRSARITGDYKSETAFKSVPVALDLVTKSKRHTVNIYED